MAEFNPAPPPLILPEAPDVLSPDIPLNPPMVGTASPFIHVDGQNRDIILEAMRTWIRVSLLPWTTSWQDQLTEWEGDVATQLDAWMVEADAYITAHAISGLSFRSTVTDIAPEGTTNVVLANVDETYRPVVVGDLILDNSPDSNYGIVTVVIDDTHATVEYVGTLRGLAGFSWRLTATPIAPEGTTNVVLTADDVRPFTLGDIVLDTAGDGNFGVVTALIDSTHVTVTYAGTLAGPQGPTGATGPAGADGTNGTDGVVSTIVAGTGIAVDETDPAHPIVSATSTAGSTKYYTDPVTMNADLLGGSPLSDGTIGVLKITAQSTSLWIVVDGIWSASSVHFENALQSIWRAFIAALDLSVNTKLTLAGCTAVEGTNGTNPMWIPRINAFAQDPNAWRELTSGGNSPGIGTQTFNDNNTVSLVGVDQLDLWGMAPSYASDNSDTCEVWFSGQMAANGHINMTMSGPPGGGLPDTNPAHYIAFGSDDEYDSGTYTHNADFVQPAGSFGFGEFLIVADTSGSPTFVEVKMVISHLADAAPTIIELVSYFYDAASMTLMYIRKGTFYYTGALALTGMWLRFDHAFTGTIGAKSL